MKKKYTILLTISLFFILTLLKAEIKDKKGDHFIKINSNIENEELRTELQNLRKQFNIEKDLLHEEYSEKMEALKVAKKNDVKALKNDFAKHRELLLNKYSHKKRKKSKKATVEPIRADSLDKIEFHKKKKRVRKP